MKDLIQQIKHYFSRKEIISGDNGFMEESYGHVPVERLPEIREESAKLMDSFMKKYPRT